MKFLQRLFAAPFLAGFVTRLLDEDPPHRLGRRAKEMSAVLPPLLARPSEPKPGLVNQGGGLERLAGVFMRQLARRKLAQLRVHQREQFAGGFGIALFDSLKNSG